MLIDVLWGWTEIQSIKLMIVCQIRQLAAHLTSKTITIYILYIMKAALTLAWASALLGLKKIKYKTKPMSQESVEYKCTCWGGEIHRMMTMLLTRCVQRCVLLEWARTEDILHHSIIDNIFCSFSACLYSCIHNFPSKEMQKSAPLTNSSVWTKRWVSMYFSFCQNPWSIIE